jgi:hypothetical protein
MVAIPVVIAWPSTIDLRPLAWGGPKLRAHPTHYLAHTPAVFTQMGPLDADLLHLIAPRSSHRKTTGVGAMDSGHCPPPRGAGPLVLRDLLRLAPRVCR